MIVTIKNKVKQMLFGLTIPQQYLCLGVENFPSPLRTTITRSSDFTPVFLDHVLLGYKPVVLAFVDNENVLGDNPVCLHFHQDRFDINSRWRGLPSDENAVAKLLLGPLSHQLKRLSSLKLYVASAGKHNFIGFFQQWNNTARDRFKKERPGNVDLSGNLHDMVRIAYSLPRTVAVASVKRGDRMNLFPTDLHGRLNDQFYISSLRRGGKAQQQVDEVRQIVISEVSCETYRDVYALGKNHMKDMVLIDARQVSAVSEKFNHPLPPHTLRYVELNVVDSFDIGIHRLYLYTIANEVELSRGQTLAHIHQYYAQWRKNNGLQTDYLLR